MKVLSDQVDVPFEKEQVKHVSQELSAVRAFLVCQITMTHTRSLQRIKDRMVELGPRYWKYIASGRFLRMSRQC
jgi:hypothetical protein